MGEKGGQSQQWSVNGMGSMQAGGATGSSYDVSQVGSAGLGGMGGVSGMGGVFAPAALNNSIEMAVQQQR